MNIYAFAAPVLPGKSDRHREFARSLGSNAEARAMHDRAGVERLRLYRQETPQGEFAVVVLDCDDGERAVRTLMSGTDEISAWFRSELAEIHGIDAEDPTAVPTPELIGQWSAANHDPSSGDWAFLVPIGRGKVDTFRSMMEQMLRGSQRSGFEETREMVGVTRQTMFLFETPMGAFALPVLEGPGASRVFAEQLKRDDHPFFGWWRDQVRNVTGHIPMGPPKVEKLLDLKVRTPAMTKR